MLFFASYSYSIIFISLDRGAKMSSLFFQSSSLKYSGIYLFNKRSLESCCCSSSSSVELRRRSAHFRQQTGLFIRDHFFGDVARRPSSFLLFLVVFGVDVCGISRESHSHGESLVAAVFAEEVFLFFVVVFLLFLFLFSFSSLVVGARNLVFFVLLFRSPLLFLLGSGRR
jgi:hypothetical protein